MPCVGELLKDLLVEEPGELHAALRVHPRDELLRNTERRGARSAPQAARVAPLGRSPGISQGVRAALRLWQRPWCRCCSRHQEARRRRWRCCGRHRHRGKRSAAGLRRHLRCSRLGARNGQLGCHGRCRWRLQQCCRHLRGPLANGGGGSSAGVVGREPRARVTAHGLRSGSPRLLDFRSVDAACLGRQRRCQSWAGLGIRSALCWALSGREPSSRSACGSVP
mmetsp:Transcript_25211/g.79498  ORF Transcript_25211/g.79498 Transcript_25211/m.79498 type:complete len:223 (-) Transcript_25211:596-1264(-)